VVGIAKEEKKGIKNTKKPKKKKIVRRGKNKLSEPVTTDLVDIPVAPFVPELDIDIHISVVI